MLILFLSALSAPILCTLGFAALDKLIEAVVS